LKERIIEKCSRKRIIFKPPRRMWTMKIKKVDTLPRDRASGMEVL
jgi:hypothetical protein